jgi:hypothetical protein
MLSVNSLSRSSPYQHEITGDHHCGFHKNTAQYHIIRLSNRTFENLAKFKYFLNDSRKSKFGSSKSKAG